MAGAPVRAEPKLAFDGGRYQRMRMTNDEGAVATEVVDVLVAVDVPLATAGGPSRVDRVGQQRAAIVREPCRNGLARPAIKRKGAARAGARCSS